MANPLRSGQTVKVNEDDVLSLVEMFPGMDRELIETVMTEVNGEIGEAIEKLLEISEKSTVQRLPEQNDLALIACSLLADESNNVVEQQGGGFASTQPPDSVTDKELCLDNSLDDISTFSDIVESEMSKELGNWIEIASGDNGESSNGIFSCAASMDEGKVNTPECAEQHDSIAQSSPEACVSESQTAVMMESSVPSNNLSLNVSVAPSTGSLTTVLSQASPATVVSKTANSGPLQKASEVLKENVAPERRKKEQHQKSWDNFFDSFGIDPLPSADDSLDIDSLIKSVSDTLDAPFGSEIKALQTDNSRVSVGSHKKGGQGGRGRKKKRGTDMKKGPAESAHPQSREAETSKDVPALAQNYKLSPASKEFVPQFLGSLSQADPNLDNSSSMALSLDVSTWTPAVAPKNVGSKQEATRQKNLSEQNHFTKRLDHKKENVVPKDMQESREFGNEPTRLPGGPSVTKAKIFSNLDSGEWKTVVSHPRSGKQVPSQPGVTRTGQVPWRNHSNAKGVNGRQPTPLLQTPISKPVGVTTRVIKNGSGFVPQQSSKGMETLPSLFSPYFPPNDTIKNVKLSAGQIPNAKIPSLMPQEPGQTVKNKLVFHGVKSAVGMARRYFQEQQPVMFILRGLPGSGKSYLANQLLEQSNCMGSAGAVLSSDDFFQQRGGYFFDRHRLDEAHTWNQQRAVKCARNGVSPIIIDNTNTMMWELLPYAVLALEHNYDVQVVEPDTVWRSNLKELTRRNIHGVNREHIKRMKDRYEELTTEKVLQQAGRHFKIKRPNFVKPMTRGKPVHTTRPEKGSSKNKSPTTPLAEVYAEAGADSSSKQIGSCEPFGHLENSLEWLEAKAQRLPTQRRRDRGNSASEEEGKGMITSEFLRQSLKSAILGVINTPNVSTTDSSDHHQSVDDLSLRSGSSSESGEGREDELCSEKILAPVHPLQSDSTTVPSDKFVVLSSNAAISCSSSSVSADNTSVPATITAVASCVPVTSADTSNASSGNLTQTSVSTTVPSSTSVPPSVSTPATTLRLDSAKSLVGYSDSDKSDEDTISSNKPAVSVSSLNVGKMTGSESENGETCGDDQKVVRDPPASVMGEQGSSDALGSVNTSDTRWDGDRVRSLSPQELETRSASTSAHASREQSPCVNSDGSTAASTPRKKKQRQRKGRAVPAFLDESVKIQSQSTSWSAFEPQIPKLESLTDVSPSVSLVKREVKSSSCQSEAYYLSAVYRLNSPAFKDFAPADLQESDYKIITSSSQPLSFPGCGQAVEEVAVPRKEGTSDKSTETDEMLEQDTVDLETLQSCFPEYSKKQLEETLAVCHNNMEWVTNHLLDSTALGSEDSDGEEPKVSSDSAGRLANSVGSVLRLATLCSEVLKSLSHVDSDDLEMQVIQAAQTRLQRIEKFNWGRLLSVHSDRAQFGGDDLSIDNFTGTVSADECWEWIPSQDSLEYVQPLMASPVTPVKTPPAFTLDREPWRAKHKVPELRTPVKQPRSPRSASFLRRSDSLSLAPKPGPASAALSPLEEYLQSAGGEARSPVKVATGPNQVVVPADFIQQLELMFGPLQRPEPDQGEFVVGWRVLWCG
ncbi:uncharacterized protein LOC101853872 [Aplysia californica]|uniref:Uncharacterized protein LOC101853872 n=1 Tax=Aplysia californica TaxID=6500 RepID=A0ABM1A4Y8_APLCA|nr:uncharacterized protein LOC101853872 [Aplysia californica]